MADHVDRALVKAVEDLGRTLKEISSTLKEQNRILKGISSRIPKDQKTLDEPVVIPPSEAESVVVSPSEEKSPPKTYGWSMANSVQRDGGLNIGDMKIEQDDSKWFWTGETWERVELPSGET